VQALLGDKILGSAAATALVELLKEKQKQQQHDTDVDSTAATTSLDTGSLTKRISHAVSNAFLAQHVDQILPNFTAIIDRSSEWELGTAVEAAVCAVHNNSNNNDGTAAVADLARFLVERAAATTTLDGTNAKGALLERGGHFPTSRRVGGGDHNPVFEAVACLQHEAASATGSTKKRAEMLAAERVLELVDGPSATAAAPVGAEDAAVVDEEDAAVVGEEPQTITTIPPPPQLVGNNNNNNTSMLRYGQWELFENINGIELENSESRVEWWTRGATAPKLAFHRAMMAPCVFANRIRAVDSWVRRREEPADEEEEDGSNSTNDPATDAAAVFMMIVDVDFGYHMIPVETAVSATQARRAIGVRANETIAKLVGVTLPGAASTSNVEYFCDSDQRGLTQDDLDDMEHPDYAFDSAFDSGGEDDIDSESDDDDDETVDDKTKFLRQCTVPQLQERLRERGLSVNGNKARLMERLAKNL